MEMSSYRNNGAELCLLRKILVLISFGDEQLDSDPIVVPYITQLINCAENSIVVCIVMKSWKGGEVLLLL